jgi:hypothetical protein
MSGVPTRARPNGAGDGYFDWLLEQFARVQDAAVVLGNRLHAARRRIAVLEAALDPYAALADNADWHGWPDDTPVQIATTLGSLRAIARARDGEGPEVEAAEGSAAA